jgi:hypothetical protein
LPRNQASNDDFDIAALFQALDAQRIERRLSWRDVADQIWNLSDMLNAQRNDHPISPATLKGMTKRMNTSCQHALFMLRWLGRAPESFLPCAPQDDPRTSLPLAGPDRRLRWNLKKLHEILDAERQKRGLSWPQLAGQLRCSADQLTGLRTARFATNMRLAMRIVGWLQRPARDFIYAAMW